MFRLTVSRTIPLLALLAGYALQAQAPGKATLSGTIKDTTGAVINTATINLKDAAGAIQKATANAAGEYSITGISAGSYGMEVTAPGFTPKTESVTLGAAPLKLDVTLLVAQDVSSVSVEARVDPYNVVPTQPTDSLFGFDQKLEDIPRSISTADAETLLRYNVKTVNDLVTVSPGSFTGSYFGIPGSVFLRGDVGDNFFRGFRRVENRGNYQTPVAATDHIEIVKGPPSPMYGGGRIGGFMNFIPKSARSESAKWLEKATGRVSITYGSFDEKRASGEIGLPFKLGMHRAGLYAFYEDEDSHSFYKGVANRYKLGQMSFDLEVSPKIRVTAGFQGYHNEGTQNIGWNRVTQDLVDNQNYIAGSPLVSLSRNGYDIRNGDIPAGTLTTFAFQQNMASVFLDPSNAAVSRLYALDPNTIHTVKLPLDRIMIDAADFTRTTTQTSYFDVIYDLSPTIHFKNQTFFDWMNHNKFSSYGFGAGYRPWTVENKSTISFTMKPGHGITINSIGGFGYRRVQVSAGEERNDFQVVDRRDLSVGATANDRFAGPYNSNGQITFQYYNSGSYGDTGLFWMTDVRLGSRLNVTAGARYDRFTPDFWGRDFGEKNSHATATANAGTYNVSVSYKLPFHLTPYFTNATSRFLDLGQGNELDYSQVQNGTFVQTSSLYEAGIKTSLMDGKVFASMAYFRQKRAAFNNQTHLPDYYRTTGVESEVRAYLLRRLSLTAALTWQNPEQLNVPFLLGIPPSLLGISPQQAFAGRFIGDASIFGLKAPFPVGGQPHWVFSPFATVNATKNIGFTIGSSVVSSVNTGYVSSVKLPMYALTRGSIFYQRDKHMLNLAINNMFDTVYFQSQFLFWDVFIKPGALRSASLTYTYSF